MKQISGEVGFICRSLVMGVHTFRGCSNSRGIWGWLWFSRGMAHCSKGLIFAFEGFFASIGGFLILAGGLGAALSFYGDWALF